MKKLKERKCDYNYKWGCILFIEQYKVQFVLRINNKKINDNADCDWSRQDEQNTHDKIYRQKCDHC